MGATSAIVNLVFLVLIIYMISRVAHFFDETRNRLHDIEKPLEEIKEERGPKM